MIAMAERTSQDNYSHGATARDRGVPVPELAQTPPDGRDHISWMESNVQQLEVALGR